MRRRDYDWIIRSHVLLPWQWGHRIIQRQLNPAALVPLRAGILTARYAIGHGIPDGIAKYMWPGGVIVAKLRFPEPIQPVTRHFLRRNPVRTDFTP